MAHEKAGATGRGKEWSKHASDGLRMFVQDGITHGEPRPRRLAMPEKRPSWSPG